MRSTLKIDAPTLLSGLPLSSLKRSGEVPREFVGSRYAADPECKSGTARFADDPDRESGAAHFAADPECKIGTTTHAANPELEASLVGSSWNAFATGDGESGDSAQQDVEADKGRPRLVGASRWARGGGGGGPK